MTVAVAELVAAIERSGVVSREELEAALARLPPEEDAVPKALAKSLIHEKLLTPYQARELLQGRFRRLRFNHFIIRDILGVGGMGTVFLAWDTVREEEVALKVLSERFKHDSGMRARFRLEARAGLRLDHPRIVKTYELGITDDVFGEVDYSTMELFPGIALHELIGFVKRLPVGVACDVACQSANALSAVHEEGMVHRDVKPDNVLIDNDGQVKIIDFGLAMLHEAACEEEFSLAMIFGHDCLGTADYMPPEQARDSLNVDARADIYGLGCTLFVALTSKRPFKGETNLQIIEAHKSQPVPNPQDFAAEIPDDLARIVQRMMSKSPDDRFASMAAVQEALQPFAERRPIEFDFAKLRGLRMSVAIKQGRLSRRRASTATRLSSTARLTTSTTRSGDALQSTQAPGDVRVDVSGRRISDPDDRQECKDESAAAEAELLLAGYTVSDRAAAATRAMLRLPDGGLFPLSQSSFVVGRGQEADLTLNSRKLSARHCRIFFDGRTWNVADLDSKNGIAVNGEVTGGCELFSGDRLTLADDVALTLDWSRGPRRRSPWIRGITLGIVALLALLIGWLLLQTM